jgi:hypothetical protein
MPFLRRAATALLAMLAALSVFCVALPARATTYSTDFTDLWYNAPAESESGWGVNLIQQYDTMFATLFVYGTDNTPRWFVASDIEPSPAGSQNVFTGQLFQTNGSSYTATTFDPNARTNLFVGTITFTFDSATTGTLQYVINGIAVTKRIVRQTWRNNVLTGNYLGGLTATAGTCASAPNGILIFGALTVQHSGGQASMKVDFTNGGGQTAQCIFSGPYAQAGKLGSITGPWNCTVGNTAANVGSFTLSSLEANTNGFTGKFHGTDQFCTYDGQFGGVRDVF